MATENVFQDSIVREAKDLEERKVGLMDSAKRLADGANLNALRGDYLSPDYDVAGMSPDQLTALQMGRQGIGAYQPFLTAGARDVTGGNYLLGEAANTLRGADTRGQFSAAQAAMNQAALPIQQMGRSAQLTAAGIPLIETGAVGIRNSYDDALKYQQANLGQSQGYLGGAANMADQYRQANLGQSQGYMTDSVNAMNQALPQYDIAQNMVGRGLGQSDLAATQAQIAANQAGFAQGIGSLQAGAAQGQAALAQPGFNTATGTFNEALGAARQGDSSDFSAEQNLFGQGLGTSAAATARAEQAIAQPGFSRGVNALYGGADQGRAATQQAGFDQGIGSAYLAAEQAKLAAAQPGFNQASSTLQQGIGALGGGARAYDPSSAQQFMNPYQQQVIDESIRQINRQGDISRQNLQAQATRAGAFGGSREGVQRAELERAISEQRNAAIVGGLSSGYGSAQQQALQAFEQQQQRQLAQAQGYQGAAGTQANIASQQAGLGQSAAQQLAQAAQLEAGTAGTRAGVGLQAAGLSQAAGQGDISAANTQAGLGLQGAGLLQNVGQAQISAAGTQGQLGLSAAQQRAAAGQASLQGASQLAGMETQGAQLGQSAAQYMGNIGQNLGQQQLQQAQIGQAAANLKANVGQTIGQQQLQQAQIGQGAAGLQGNLANQYAALSGMYNNTAGQQANIFGQQSQLSQQLGQGIGNLGNQQFGIGAQMAQGLGSLGTQQANIGTQKAALGQQAQALGQQDVNFQYNLGTAQQKQLQSEIDAQRQNTLQQNMQPYQQAAFVSDIYKGAPSSQMSSMTQAQATPSPFQQIAGLGVAGVSAAAAGARAGII